MAPGMGLGLGLGLTHGGAISASQRIISLATTDGWVVVYDPTNPNTRTVRDSGGSSFITEIADGLGNKEAVTQATDADQPELIVGAFGDLDAGDYPSGAAKHLDTAWSAQLSQPFSMIAVASINTINALRHMFSRTDAVSPNMSTDNSATPNIRITAGTALVDGVADVANHVFVGIFNGASSAIRIDSIEAVSGDASTQGQVNLRIGNSDAAASNRAWQGYIGPLLFRNDASLAEIQRMEDLLHDLTGIPKA